MQCNDEREDGNLGVITTNALIAMMTIPERANRVVRLGSFQGSGSCLKVIESGHGLFCHGSMSMAMALMKMMTMKIEMKMTLLTLLRVSPAPSMASIRKN